MGSSQSLFALTAWTILRCSSRMPQSAAPTPFAVPRTCLGITLPRSQVFTTAVGFMLRITFSRMGSCVEASSSRSTLLISTMSAHSTCSRSRSVTLRDSTMALSIVSSLSGRARVGFTPISLSEPKYSMNTVASTRVTRVSSLIFRSNGMLKSAASWKRSRILRGSAMPEHSTMIWSYGSCFASAS